MRKCRMGSERIHDANLPRILRVFHSQTHRTSRHGKNISKSKKNEFSEKQILNHCVQRFSIFHILVNIFFSNAFFLFHVFDSPLPVLDVYHSSKTIFSRIISNILLRRFSSYYGKKTTKSRSSTCTITP